MTEYRKVVLDGIYRREEANELVERAARVGLRAHTEFYEESGGEEDGQP